MQLCITAVFGVFFTESVIGVNRWMKSVACLVSSWFVLNEKSARREIWKLFEDDIFT
jgi:hypothetical protein